MPEQTKGIGADLGGGYGFLSREILTNCPKVERMDLYEAEYRAIACIHDTLAPVLRPLYGALGRCARRPAEVRL